MNDQNYTVRAEAFTAAEFRGMGMLCYLALVSAFICLTLGAGAARAQDAAATGWSGHGSLTARAGSERQIGELDLFVPLWQDDSAMLFGDLRAQTDDDGNQEGNVGLGYRGMGDSWIVGGYGFFDYRKSDETGNSFMQGTLGIEALSETIDLRANFYIPEGDEQAAPTATALQVIGGSLQMRAGFERALPGVDGEIGYRLWGSEDGGREIRAFAGGYYFDAADYDTVAGARGRVEARLFDLDFLGAGSRFTLGAEVTQDSVRDTQGFAVARLTIPFGGGRRSGRGGLDRRMTDYVVRDVDVITSAAATGPAEGVTYAGSGATVGNVLVFGGGDDIAGAMAGSGAGDLIIVNGAIDTTATIALQDSQILTSAGLGIDVVGVNTGTQLTYTAPGTRGIINGDVAGGAVVALASNSVVADIDINNTALVVSSHGISGDTVTGASVTGSNISTFGDDGIFLLNASDNTVSDNIITTSGDGGAGLHLFFASTNTISNNAITTGGLEAEGIFLNTGSASNLITANNIATTGDLGHGITLGSLTAGANTISDNVIATSGNSSFGMRIFSAGNTVSGNDIATIGDGATGMFVRGNSNDINGNSIATNGANAEGISMGFSDGNTVNANVITTAGLGAHGIFTESDTNSVVSANDITTSASNAHGIIMASSDNDVIDGNIIATSGFAAAGIRAANVSLNTITANSIATGGLSSHGIHLFNAGTNTLNDNGITTGLAGANGMFLAGAATDLNTGTGNSYLGPASACVVDASVIGTNTIDLCP